MATNILATGPQGPAGRNTQQQASGGAYGETAVLEASGRYAEPTRLLRRFGGSTQAAVATTAAFATTYTGLVLANPNGSLVNAYLDKVGVGAILAQTSPLAVGLMVGQSTTAFSGVTAATSGSEAVGSNVSPVAQLYSAATLPIAPTLRRILGSFGTGAVTVDQFDLAAIDQEGSIVLTPGAFVAIYTNVASVAASLFLSFGWEERAITT